MTGSSQRTAIPLPHPLPSPTGAFADASSSPRELAVRPSGVLDVLKAWFYSYAGNTKGGRGRRVAVPAVVILVAVILPLIAFIARLRTRRRLTLKARPWKGLNQATTKSAVGTSAMRWLYEAVRDSVIMAGKGLV